MHQLGNPYIHSSIHPLIHGEAKAADNNVGGDAFGGRLDGDGDDDDDVNSNNGVLS